MYILSVLESLRLQVESLSKTVDSHYMEVSHLNGNIQGLRVDIIVQILNFDYIYTK